MTPNDPNQNPKKDTDIQTAKDETARKDAEGLQPAVPHGPAPTRGAETLAPKAPLQSLPQVPSEVPAAAKPKAARGTAAMDPETRREVARKGGLAVSRNRSHMAEIGKKGGQSISRDREHMAKIGKKGGETSRVGRKPREEASLAEVKTPMASEQERKKAV